MGKTMTKENEENNEVVQIVPEEGAFDILKRISVTTTGTAPYHKAGQKLEVSQAVADKMKANGWAE